VKLLGLMRFSWDRISIYLPVILMALLALGTYWLVRNAPTFSAPEPAKPLRHEPDYFMRDFLVKNFDVTGRLKSEVQGIEARHFPDDDTMEIDKARIRSVNEKGQLVNSTADRALANSDASEVQMFGNAVVVREAMIDKSGQILPRMEMRSDFLHAYTNVERVKTNKRVVLQRDDDQFSGDRMDYDNLDRFLQLDGRVRGLIQAKPATKPAKAAPPAP